MDEKTKQIYARFAEWQAEDAKKQAAKTTKVVNRINAIYFGGK